ncbi:MAG TPA: hypothetical protein VHW65_06860, partial [Gemmatimonadales bacterium]|nr:hypothetical protein [Gemmatimonadales bacterium]
YLPARGGRPHLRALIAQIDQLAPDTTWDGPRTIARAAQLLARRGLLATISDFYDAEDATRRELRQAVRRGHDVAMLQLISRDERDLPYDGAVEFADLESGARRILDARAAAPVYRAAVSAFLERCRTAALRDGIDYALIGVDTPPETALRHYLLARRGSGAGVPTGVGA